MFFLSGIASTLDGGKGRIKEAVEASRDGGSRALQAAASHGRMPVCVYLVEKLRVNVNVGDNKGALFGLLLWFRKLQNTSVPTN